jgi:2-oxo-3-hexenedioate decarboxylase
MTLWDDLRVRRGLARQLEQRHRMIAAGAQPIGWKAGFGSAAAMEAIGTTGPLVGFMTDRSRLADGAELSIAGWTAPTVEVEIAVRMGRDVPGGSDRDTAAAAIAALAPAIELVDLDGPRGRDDVENALAGNIFHRHVVLGAFDASRAGGDTAGIRLSVDGRARSYAADADPAALVGDLSEVVRQIADLLDAAGERLRADEVLITGAAVALIDAEPGEQLTCRFAGLGDVSVRFAG